MWRRPLGGLLLLLLLSAVPLAYASPPDQTWISGWYDNADYDDVVATLTATVALVEGAPCTDVSPLPLVVGIAAFGDDGVAPALRQAPRQPRAPPLA